MKIKRIFNFTPDYQTNERVILRDYLALQRTKLANERTLLSYIRTSLYFIVGGIAFLGMKDLNEIKNVGYLSIALSIIILFLGIGRYFQLKRNLRSFYKSTDKQNIE